eukprot:1158016-Pelagomonas_calceolata.AAC.8
MRMQKVKQGLADVEQDMLSRKEELLQHPDWSSKWALAFVQAAQSLPMQVGEACGQPSSRRRDWPAGGNHQKFTERNRQQG